jgi:dephospho-CoA kinase
MTAIIGLTGGIGTGKSTVARMLRKSGAAVIDTDKLGHRVYQHGSEAWDDIIDAFGRGIIAADGQIDRAKLGNIVFENRAALKKLNAIVHPRILELVCKQLNKHTRQGTRVVVVEAPVLIEAGWKGLVDKIWVTTAPKKDVVARLQKRSGLSVEDIDRRIRSRSTTRTLLKHATVEIRNDGTLEHLREQVAAAWSNLKENKS